MKERKYKNFYSGNNRKAIHEVFVKFIKAIKDNRFEIFDEILTQECIADFSTYGHLEGIKEIKEKMKWPGPNLDVSKARIYNFVARSHGNAAQQLAYVQFIVAKDDGVNIYPFLYGGEYVNSYTFIDNTWKINHIRFDLCYEFGNNMFVKDKWRLIDYAKYCGHVPMINPELDNPWYSIEDDEEQSDEEQIFELMYKYAFAFDHADFTFLRTFTTEDFLINGGKTRKDYWETPLESNDFFGHRQISDFLRDKCHKEAKMIHSCRMLNIEIDGDLAIAYMARGEEHRLKNRLIDRYNIHSEFTTAIHFIYAKKIDGNWKMYKYRIEPISKTIPVSDDIVRYDEYVLGKE